jgi:hypothetical protein
MNVINVRAYRLQVQSLHQNVTVNAQKLSKCAAIIIAIRNCYNIFSLFCMFDHAFFSEVNKEPTNTLIIRCISTHYSPTCFGILGCHHQGDICDPTEMCAQCSRKQKKLGAVIPRSSHRLQYAAPIFLCFLRH